MAKRIIFPFGAVLAILLVIAGCGKPEEGMNELTLKQLEEKLNNQETFLLLTYAADEEDVKETKMIEAFNDSLKRAGLTGFYVNLKGENEKVIQTLGEKYTHPKSSKWDPLDTGLILVDKGGVVNEENVYVSDGVIDNFKRQNAVFQGKDLDNELKDIVEYVQFYNIKFTN